MWHIYLKTISFIAIIGKNWTEQKKLHLTNFVDNVKILLLVVLCYTASLERKLFYSETIEILSRYY